METATDPIAVNHSTFDTTFQSTFGMDDPLSDIHDDSRSSSLSEIDDLDNEHLEDLSPRPEKFASEIDSEAETERIEESPSRIPNQTSIVLSGNIYGASPSKLAQSTTYDELDDDDQDEAELSPSKPPRTTKSNGFPLGAVPYGNSHSNSQDFLSKKRKRLDNSGRLIAAQDNDEEPSRKRRGSIQPETPASISPFSPPIISRAPMEEDELEEPTVNETSNAQTPLTDDALIDGVPPSPKGKRGKKDKRKGKRVKDLYEESIAGENEANSVVDEPAEDAAAELDEANDPEAAVKLEELAKKTTAMDVLCDLERHFATLRDRIYDERIASINRELAALESPEPTHPEFLRQTNIVQQFCDEKIDYEHLLFSYRLASLCTRSQAEQSQSNSTYFQRARDIREQALDAISEHQYKVQHDRFQSGDPVPEYSIPFPTRLSKQIAQQAAYNHEVSVLAGFAKYVGFPAAPALKSTRHHELEDDFEKMGLHVHPPLRH
ncbi:hypothetical protein FQN57_006146 [Myotisia sp. PD_48]|nr:hypothetical protein FQN57_006146 [Myotisia sp. PD_48]